MKAVIQRVQKTTLSVEGKAVSEIDGGLTVFLGVEKGDTEEKAVYLGGKIARLRIFADENGKLNLSVLDKGLQVLLVSQFSLCARCGKGHGNRPDFGGAELPEKACALYEKVAETIEALGITVKKGVFGAHMEIQQFNDGPLTIIYEH